MEIGRQIKKYRTELKLSQEELAALDRLQKKMLRNLSALIQQDNKEVTQT